MKILVTGSGGLLGQKLSSILENEEQVQPILTARRPLTYSISRGDFHLMNIADKLSVDKVIGLTRPEVIIHAAAMTQVDDCEMQQEACWLNNVTATQNLIESARKIKTRFIFVSTDFIFDGTHGPLDETAAPSPVNYYGESKLAAEKLVMNSELGWTILRTVLVYGVAHDMSRSNIVLWVKKSLEAGEPIQVVNDQWRTPTLAEDLAMGCWLAANKKAQGIYHISGREMMTPYEIAIQTARYFNLDASLISATDSTQFKQPAKRPLKTGFIIAKAEKELGYKPHSFEEGLALVEQQLGKVS